MEFLGNWLWEVLVTIIGSVGVALGCYVFVFGIVSNINQWLYVCINGRYGRHTCTLPPGHMGWPLVGNSFSLISAFKYANPDSFINNLHTRYGESGIYKSHLYGSPTVIVCKAEACRRILTDSEDFKIGYPKPTIKLLGSRGFTIGSNAEHKRIRRLTTSPIMGQMALASNYMNEIEQIIINSLQEWDTMKKPFHVLSELKQLTFKVIIHVFMGSHDSCSSLPQISHFFADFLNGATAFPIDLPGFAYHKALKARGKLVRIFGCIVKEKRMMMMKRNKCEEKAVGNKDLVEILLEIEDEDGRKLEDEDIVDSLIFLLFAGHETSALTIMWSIIHLIDNPKIMNKAKEEQKEIVERRPPSQKGLKIKEIKQMTFLSKVIDETLRRTTIIFSMFREAKVDININGYTIPKGWKVLLWSRAVHMNPEYYSDPQQFNPSRWDDYKAKPGCYLPFGAGPRFCPGSDLAKLEISIFLHHFLLHY